MTCFSLVDKMEEGQSADSGDAVQPPKLPFELLDLITRHTISIATEESDKETMKACSLVFFGWRIPFQRALFRIKIPYFQFSEYAIKKERNIIYNLRDLLGANPSFQQAITSLRLRILASGTLLGSTPDFMPFLFSHLISVDTLRIDQTLPLARHHSWTRLTKEAQGALTSLFRSPSIRHLIIWSFDAPLAVTFPESAERDTVDITCSRSPDLQDDSPLFDGSDLNDWDATKSPLRLCIVRHLTSTTSIASKLLRATRVSKAGIRTPFIDSSAIYSVDMDMEDQRDLRDVRTVLHRANSLQKLTVCGGGMDGLFQKPQPGCLASLEEICLTFRWISEPENLIKIIIHEFSVYPPANVLKNATMKIPSFKHAYDLPLAEKLRDDLLALGDLFGKTCRFPLLERVEVMLDVGTVYRLDWGRDRELRTDIECLSKILEEVMVEFQKIGLGSKFTICAFANMNMPQGADSPEVPQSQSPSLPFEVLDIIVHIIRLHAMENGPGDNETVKACSLVFSPWRLLFQSALLEMKGVCLTFSNGTTAETRFGVHYVMLDVERRRVRALRDLLDVDPSFGRAITSLILQIVDEDCLGDSESNSGLTVSSMLSLLTNVRTLSFSRFDSDDLGDRSPEFRTSGSWKKFPPMLKDAIAFLFRSPSLKNLTVASFDGPLDVLLPEGGQIDTLTLGIGVVPATFNHFLDLDDVDPTAQVATTEARRPCIIRHLVSGPTCAAHLLAATTRLPHPHQNIWRSVVDASAIRSLKLWGTRRDLDAQGPQAALERAINLKRFTTYAGIPRVAARLPFSFQEPHPLCFTRQLDEIEIIFRCHGLDPGRDYNINGQIYVGVPSLNRLSQELRLYPANSVLKHLTLKAYFGWNRREWLAGRQELTDSFLDLARTLSAPSGFAALQSVLLYPVVSYNFWRLHDTQESQNLRMEEFSKDFEHVGMVLDGMNLPFRFSILKPRIADGRSGMDRGIDRDDARWYESVTQDNIVEL